MAGLMVDGAGKCYERGRWALRDVSLRLDTGLLGLVGPNGAGKTTLLRMLATLLTPTEGVIIWDGQDVVRQPQPLRQVLGYLPQDFGVYPRLTARELLRYIGELKRLSGPLLQRRVEAVLEAVHLRDDGDRRLCTYSGGMIRRVGIAQALLNEPRLLLLDEPTAGLDPSERISFRGILAALSVERLVVLSTHIMSDIEAMATDLALLQHGQLTWTGTPAELLADAEGQVWELRVPPDEFERLQTAYVVSAATRRGTEMEVRLIAPVQPHPLAASVTPTLEDAYMFAVGVRKPDARVAVPT